MYILRWRKRHHPGKWQSRQYSLNIIASVALRAAAAMKRTKEKLSMEQLVMKILLRNTLFIRTAVSGHWPNGDEFRQVEWQRHNRIYVSLIRSFSSPSKTAITTTTTTVPMTAKKIKEPKALTKWNSIPANNQHIPFVCFSISLFIYSTCAIFCESDACAKSSPSSSTPLSPSLTLSLSLSRCACVCVCTWMPNRQCVTCQCHTTLYFVCLSEKRARVLNTTPLCGRMGLWGCRQSFISQSLHTKFNEFYWSLHTTACTFYSHAAKDVTTWCVCVWLCVRFCTWSRLHCCISIARNMRSVGPNRVFFLRI